MSVCKIVKTALAGFFVSFVMSPCGAAVRTWCGPSGEQDWTAATNWVDEAVPTGTDTAYFPHNAAYHSNGTGKRRYWFKVTPPAGFAGTILTTNELWSLDSVSASYLNVSFCPTLEITAGEGAAWTLSGNGTVIATDGIAARLADGFKGTIEVRKGSVFAPPASLDAAVRFTGAGSLVLSSGSQFSRTEAFAGSIVLPPSESVPSATAASFQGADVTLSDGQTLAFDANALAYRPVMKIESFADDPGKWTFNGTAWAEGNLPSGPFNPDPPYVRDGELWLTDEPAQIHTVWYTNRTFRLVDDWGMKFTYNPELPSGTRITTEKRADGNTRSHCISGYFGILFSRSSPVNVGVKTDSEVRLANDARGFLLDLYRDDPCAKVMWLAESNKYNYRSVWESETGLKLNAAMDVVVSMIKGVMTVTLVQNGKSATYSHDYSQAINERAAEGCYIGFGGSTGWWGDSYAVPWARHRISNFRAWCRSETEGPGWVDVDNAAAFDIHDSSKWDYRKVTRTSATTETTNNASLFVADGVRLTDAATSNCAFMISKANPPKRAVPLRFSYRFKTADPFWKTTEYGQITFLFGNNSDNTRNNGASWSSPAYGNTFGTWNDGLDWMWDANKGDVALNQAYHVSGQRNATGITLCDSLGTMGSTYAAAMNAPEKDLRADIVWNPNGTFKAITSISAQDHTGNGRCGSRTYTGLAERNNYANFTNRTDWCVGVKAVCRNNAYAAITLTELSVKRLAAAVGGEIHAVSIPAGASATIVAGDAMAGQTQSVLSVSGLSLGAGATLTVRPETSGTIVSLESVSSANATLVAAAGSSVRIEGALALSGDPAGAGLTLGGDVSVEGPLAVTIPSSWRTHKTVPVMLVDARNAVAPLAVSAGDISVSDENGPLSANRHKVLVGSDGIMLDLRNGFSVILR